MPPATKKARVSNGTTNGHHATTKHSHAHPPPTQTSEGLSDQEKNRLRTWLEKFGNPFQVATFPVSRKRKRQPEEVQIQDDLFEDRLSVQYEVKPKDKWESLRKYKKFTVGSESIATGQCILVKCDESEESQIDYAAQWKAKVLEVRALDPEHVFLRVAWLNRPEDLESGRKQYHGKNELIPTNQMDVIDAMAVNGSLDLVHWDDDDDDDAPADDTQYFWRQTFDQANTKTFSKLRIICVCNTPQNPDEMIISCSGEDCRKWQHVKCMAKKALEAAVPETHREPKNQKKANQKKARSKSSNLSTNPSAVATEFEGDITAEVFVKGKAGEFDAKKSARTQLVITDTEGERQPQPLCCLYCGTTIED